MEKKKIESLIRLPIKKLFSVTGIITVHCYDMAPEYDFGESRVYDFWEIFYIDRGEAQITCGDRSGVFRQGDAMFVSPGQHHTIKCDGEHSASVFIITFDCKSAAMEHFRDRTFKIRGDLSVQMQRLIEECTRNVRTSSYPLHLLDDAPYGGCQLIGSYLEILMISLIRSENEKARRAELFPVRERDERKLAMEISDYLKSRVMDRVTVDDVCRRFNYGKSYLCETFAGAFGTTMMKYHTSLKIDEAKLLLREENLSVAAVAERLSYDSPEYFSKVFKATVGMTPSAFRNTLINGRKRFLR